MLELLDERLKVLNTVRPIPIPNTDITNANVLRIVKQEWRNSTENGMDTGLARDEIRFD